MNLHTLIDSLVGSKPLLFFFFNDTATTEIYTLSLHDALPIFHEIRDRLAQRRRVGGDQAAGLDIRSEEHTSELQSLRHLVCRLLLEKKKSMSAVRFLHAADAHIVIYDRHQFIHTVGNRQLVEL